MEDVDGKFHIWDLDTETPLDKNYLLGKMKG
jgi:hypothetical protein